MPVSLMEEIQKFKKETFPKLSKDVVETFMKTTDDLVKSGIDRKALRDGDNIPDFVLPDGRGSVVSSQDLLQQGPCVISFYRGGWCPYCSLELRALQEYYPLIKEQGANLIAISPQLPDLSQKTLEENHLDFYVVSDHDNKVAKSFGLVFPLVKQLANLFRIAFDLDLREVNGTDSYELPIPATYVVDQEGCIRYSFIDADYTNRLEPQEIVNELKQIP